jgi:hypothetical protein
MTPANALRRAIDSVARPLRGLSGLARLVAGLAGAATILAAAAWSVRTGWIAAPAWILAVWLLTGIILAGSLLLARRAIDALGPWHIGVALERSGAWRHGALTTALDDPADGTSRELHDAATTQRAAEVSARGPAVLAPAMHRQRLLSRRAGAVLVVALVGLVAARPATGAPGRLWNPIGAWRALVAPVRLSARSATVRRGERATLDVAAIGHRHATLFTRAPGEAWQTTDVALDVDGAATITTAPLGADLVARIEAGGHVSPEVRVAIRLAAFLGSFTATAHYPAYLGFEDEALPTTGDTLVLPEGTRLSLDGRATTPLATARLRGPSGTETLAVTGSSFHGAVMPRESGSWRLDVTPASGGALEGDRPALPVRIVVDSAPVVEIPVPGADTVAAPSMSLALVVGVRDDHGIASAAVESRRGTSGTVIRMPLPLPHGVTDRALITVQIDLAALGLKPGDTLRYAAVAVDNAPAHHAGRSREFVVRVPTEAEQRAARARETVETATGFDSLGKQAARVQRTEEDLARERQRTDPKAANAKAGDEGQKDPLASETARKAEAAAQAQQKVLDDAAKLQKAVQELRDAAERDGPADSTLARELNEINKLLDQAMSPELRDKLGALQQAVKALDADRTRTALQDLAKQQAALKEAMDQARELFTRAALESSLAKMGQDANQLAAEQHELVGKLAHGDSGKSAKAENDLAKRADSLAAGLDQAADQVPAQQPKQGLQQAGQQARDAAARMREAAQSSQSGKDAQAQAEAKQAEDQLNPLSKNIDNDRQNMQAEMRAEVKQALDRALQETARLAQRQLDLVPAFQQGALLPQTRLDEGLVEEGVGKLAQQMTAVAAMNALVSPQAVAAFAEARQLMRDAIDDVAAANPNVHDAYEKSGDAVDALAVAAYSLMQSKDRINGSQSGSGVQEAMEQMKEMAGKQGQLAQQGSGMMQEGGATAQQVLQMAMQQRALAQQLERMRAAGQLPGAGQMAREAKELQKALEGGRLKQDVVDRQQKLFKRMLDAGRTLRGEEDDEKKERQSTTAKDAPPAIPPALDPRIRNGTGEIRLPGWESLQRLSPEERRRVVEYFQRLTQGGHP